MCFVVLVAIDVSRSHLTETCNNFLTNCSTCGRCQAMVCQITWRENEFECHIWKVILGTCSFLAVFNTSLVIICGKFQTVLDQLSTVTMTFQDLWVILVWFLWKVIKNEKTTWYKVRVILQDYTACIQIFEFSGTHVRFERTGRKSVLIMHVTRNRIAQAWELKNTFHKTKSSL